MILNVLHLKTSKNFSCVCVSVCANKNKKKKKKTIYYVVNNNTQVDIVTQPTVNHVHVK